MILLCVTLGAMMIAGCGGGGGGADNSTEGRIKANYSSLVNATDRDDIGAVINLFSVNYYNQGYNIDDVKISFADFFTYYSDIDEHIEVHSIDRSGSLATVDIREWWYGTDPNGVRKTVDPAYYTDVWRLENGSWVLYGDQKSAPGVGPAGRTPSALRVSRSRPTMSAPPVK